MTRLAPLLLVAACSTWASTGSLVRERCTHVGLRAQPEEMSLRGLTSRDWTVSAQITTDWPYCPRGTP